ncbi:uncharacterized protein LOC111054408 [Nilaparvata lugens]|uniref:uncharacterized protein LOC111054408 n=1 Tax=Nilaparvata lugens TaxID=108931 RepID=UPI00193E1642|nr:uncharacterized protein LOC111054408 [Nilaparvata lugens]
MRPSLEAEIIDLERRIATLEENKIGNLRREHGEIISTYEKMFDTLRFVNFNKVLMILKINMMEIKSLEEDCSRECSKNQLVILLQKETATCLMKMIQIGQEENSLLFENNQRVRDRIRLKLLEIAKLSAEKDKLLAKTSSGSKVVVQEKNINRYCVPQSSKCDIFSATYDTAGYHPNILKRSKIPVLKLPLTSVVETVPFQIKKKPIKVTIPRDHISMLKKSHPGRVVKPKVTQSCERNIMPKVESHRLGEKQKQGKRTVVRKSSNNFTVTNSKIKSDSNTKNDNLIISNQNNVGINSGCETPKTNSKIPVRVASSAKKSSKTKENNDYAENSTPALSKHNGSDDNHNISTKNNNNNNDSNRNLSITVGEAAEVFKTLNEYCDKIETMYGPPLPPYVSIEEKLAHKKKPVLCNPCMPIKFRSEKKLSSPEVVTIEDKFYGSMESMECAEQDGVNDRIEETSIVVHEPETAANESQVSTFSIQSSETGTTVISVPGSSVQESSYTEDLCESSFCLETLKSASKCLTPTNDEFRAGGDGLNSSVAGNFRFLDYESENKSPNTPDENVQFRTDVDDHESPNSSLMINGKRRRSEIFHISFNSDKKKVDKSNSPYVFKVV